MTAIPIPPWEILPVTWPGWAVAIYGFLCVLVGYAWGRWLR